MCDFGAKNTGVGKAFISRAAGDAARGEFQLDGRRVADLGRRDGARRGYARRSDSGGVGDDDEPAGAGGVAPGVRHPHAIRCIPCLLVMEFPMFFETKVDQRSRAAMIEFLSSHYRYDAVSSVNRATSYAHCVKLHRLGLTAAQSDSASDVLSTDFVDEISWPIDEFTRKQGGCYTIGFNGRSGGYLVLFESRYEDTGHKSRCRTCGQLNFCKTFDPAQTTPEGIIQVELLRSRNVTVPADYLKREAIAAIKMADEQKLTIIRRLAAEQQWLSLGNKCGLCHAEGDRGRVNLQHSNRRLSVYGRAIDQDIDFNELSLFELKRKVELVRAFDRACDEVRDAFIDLIEECEVVTETVMVPTEVQVRRPRAISA